MPPAAGTVGAVSNFLTETRAAYSLPLSKWKSPHLINSSVRLSVCLSCTLLVWFSSKIPRISNVHLYPGPKALGTNVEIWGRRPLVCRRRKAPICVSNTKVEIWHLYHWKWERPYQLLFITTFALRLEIRHLGRRPLVCMNRRRKAPVGWGQGRTYIL